MTSNAKTLHEAVVDAVNADRVMRSLKSKYVSSVTFHVDNGNVVRVAVSAAPGKSQTVEEQMWIAKQLTQSKGGFIRADLNH